MPDENLSLSNIKLNGTKYELKDGLVRETLLTPSNANIGKVWTTSEVESGQTATSDIIAQTTINLNGNPENNPVTILYWPDEGEEYKVSFDFYNGNTLIESINETLVSNRSIGFYTEDTDYIYGLTEYDRGAYGIFVDLREKTFAESPYKLVNFHVYQETPIMAPQTGWTSQAVPVPTSNDINKYLQVSTEIKENQILTHGSSVHISRNIETVPAQDDISFNQNLLVDEGMYTTNLIIGNSTESISIDLSVVNSGNQKYLQHYGSLGENYFQIYPNGSIQYGKHSRPQTMNVDIIFSDIIGPINAPKLSYNNTLYNIIIQPGNNYILDEEFSDLTNEDIFKMYKAGKQLIATIKYQDPIYILGYCSSTEAKFYYIDEINQQIEIILIDRLGINKETFPISDFDGDYESLINTPDLSNYMIKGTDYVTAGQLEGSTLGTKATAEGYNTTASGDYSHAEGSNTIASGGSSHAEGTNTVASGGYSHAEGYYTTASGVASHAEGRYTTAQRRSQHVFGEFNILDRQGSGVSEKGKYIEIVGMGLNSANRYNARTLDWSGNEVLAGKLTVGTGPTNNMDVATKQYVDNSIPTIPTNVSAFTNDAGYLTSYTETDPTVPTWAKASTKPTYTASEVGALPDTTVIPSDISDLTDTNNIIPAAQVQSDWNATTGMGVILNKPDTSTFMVKGTDYVTAGLKEGTTLGTKATAEGVNATASGNASHAEGRNATASGTYSHAEGRNATASGTYSHAEGAYTTASGNSSHAEGNYTTAGGDYSHAEGNGTTAGGDYSHAEGNGTTAQRASQHVFGEYNIADTSGTTTTRGTYVEIVGNGTSNAPSNARTLDWQGNEVLTGKLTVGVAPTNNMDVATKQYVDTATTITNTLSSGTLIATINGTNIYAPSYTDADGVSY